MSHLCGGHSYPALQPNGLGPPLLTSVPAKTGVRYQHPKVGRLFIGNDLLALNIYIFIKYHSVGNSKNTSPFTPLSQGNGVNKTLQGWNIAMPLYHVVFTMGFYKCTRWQQRCTCVILASPAQKLYGWPLAGRGGRLFPACRALQNGVQKNVLQVPGQYVSQRDPQSSHVEM